MFEAASTMARLVRSRIDRSGVEVTVAVLLFVSCFYQPRVQVRCKAVLAFVLRLFSAGVVRTVFVLLFAVAMLFLSLRGFGGRGGRVLR